jgi:hypothetical protein
VSATVFSGIVATIVFAALSIRRGELFGGPAKRQPALRGVVVGTILGLVLIVDHL